MPSDQDVQRETAAGAVDETNAFLSACLSTAEPSGTPRTAIASVQECLQTISAFLHEPGDPPPASLPRLRDVRETTRTWQIQLPAAPVIPQGHSMAAAMMRPARATGQRAHRELRRINGLDPAVLDFMSALPELFSGLAHQFDAEEERSIPRGLCG